ncbi:MAG: iron-sulfur cluster-binding domain-containing protein [Deltaproteobacteria bacterium]|nr:iron-sulfur cluster-binding domain-containing protein [Deltaproteobacteria bacterium]
MDTLQPVMADQFVESLRTALDRALGWLTYPRKPEEYFAALAPRHFGPLRAEIIALEPHFDGCATLVLRTDKRFVAHKPGQFVALTLEIDGVRRTRCFSISSAPRSARGPRVIELTIKSTARGTVTPRLVHPSIVGTTVELSPPRGSFVLDDELPPRLLFITGGSGITPVISMLRALDQKAIREGAPGAKGTLLHFAKSEREALFLDELKQMPWLDLHLVTEEALGRMPSLDEASLAAVVSDFEDTRAYACGPAPLLKAVEAAFAARGAPGALTIERFQSAFDSGGEGEGKGTVHFARSNKTVNDHRTLLVVAEEQGLEPKSGCRMGICGTCHCKKLSGATRDLRTGEVSTEANVDIALCSTVAIGDVSIDL